MSDQGLDLQEPLSVRLARVRQSIDAADPVFGRAMDEFVARLERANAGSQVPDVDDKMPNFILPDEEGKLVSLEGLLVKGPVIVTFHRGHWCPYCKLSVEALAQTEARLRPAQIVAISGDRTSYSKAMKQDAQANFPILTDIDLGYALSLNLSIWVDDKSARLIANAGIDVAAYQGTAGWFLPIPAVFVVAQDGIIKARHVDPDYRRRVDMDDLIKMTEALG